MRASTYWLAVVLAVGLGAASPSAAQSSYFVPAPKEDLTLVAGPCYVARVVDARPQHGSLGLVTRAGSPRLAAFQESIPGTIQAFFASHVPGLPGATPLLMRITGLEIAETPGGFTETATAGLVADFYAPRPDSSYQLVAHFAQVQERTALDATGQHAANLGHLLLEAARLACDQAGWRVGGPSYLPPAVAGQPPLPGEALPVLLPTVQPQPGFYASITEFWHNQPSEPGVPDVERHPYTTTEWRGDYEIKPYHLDKRGHLVLATEAWGFCDGEHFYIRRGRSYYQLERRGPGFVYYGQLDDDPEFRKASNSRTTSSALVLGWAAAGAAATSGERRTLFMLSLLTGKSSLSQSNSAAATAIVNRPTHLFVYRPRDAKGPAVRISLAEGLPAQALAAGDFLTFEPTSDQPLRVCLLPPAGPATYLAVTPTTEAPTYLECRPTSPEPLRKVDDKAGASALNKLSK